MRPVLVLLVTLAAIVPPSLLRAQELRGVLMDPVTNQPIAHAAVYLLEGDRVESRRLADGRGGFAFAVQVGRTYRVRVEQLGYEAFLSDPVRLDSAVTRTLRFDIRTRAVVLPSLTVAGPRRGCTIREGGRVIETLWNEARKALTAASLTEEQRLVQYQGVIYTRRLDASGRRVTSHDVKPLRGRALQPFRSLSAADLSEQGYVRPVDGGANFMIYAPDAAVLLSTEFLNDHCFSLVQGAPRSGEVGLRFEPVARRANRVDVTGTFWLNTISFKLQRFDFQYTGAIGNQPFDEALGRVEFTAAPNGSWLISGWWIRVPLFAEGRHQHGTASVQNVRVIAVHEEGGHVQHFTSGDDVYEVLAAGSLTGRVRDGTTGQPVPNAVVQLEGTIYKAHTNENGRFRIEGVYPGTYTIGLYYPGLDSLPAVEPSVLETTIVERSTTTVDLVTPSLASVRNTLCPDADTSTRSLLWGRVRRGDHTPVAGATVTVRWDSVFERVERLGTVPLTYTATTDAEGRYYLCDMPTEVQLWIRATTAAVAGSEEGFLIRSSYAVRDLVLNDPSTKEVARDFDVRADRVLKRFGGLEARNPANAMEEVHTQIAVVEIAFKVEKKHFRRR